MDAPLHAKSGHQGTAMALAPLAHVLYSRIMRYDPAVPIQKNAKPILYAVGENDPTFPLPVAQRVVDATTGPVDFFVLPDGKHQLMLFHTEQYSAKMLDWCRGLLKK